MPTKNLLRAIHDGLAEEMRADDTVVVLGEDVGRAGGVFRVTDGLPAHKPILSVACDDVDPRDRALGHVVLDGVHPLHGRVVE